MVFPHLTASVSAATTDSTATTDSAVTTEIGTTQDSPGMHIHT